MILCRGGERLYFPSNYLANYHKEYKKIAMDNVSLLAEDSHGKKKLGERREISAGLRRVLSFSRRSYLWSKLTGFQNQFRLKWNAHALLRLYAGNL